MNRPALAIAVAVPVLAWVGYLGYRSLAPEPTKIRRVLDEVVAAFNAADRSACLAPFATDYTHTSIRNLNRSALGRILFRTFTEHRDRTSGRLHYQLRLGEEPPSVEIQEDDPSRAQARLELFVDVQPQTEAPVTTVWHLRVQVEFNRPDGRWHIHRSSHETLSGAPPG